MSRLPSLAIVISDQVSCSGSCYFCHGMNHNMHMGISKQDLDKALRAMDERTAKEARFDFPALEATILNTPKWKSSGNKFHFSIWGTDPLTSFENLQQTVDFLNDLGKRHNKQIHISFSTNGLPILRDDVAQWLMRQSNMTFQLSHDGYGQFFRTQDVDPLKFDNTLQLIQAGKITSISCILHQFNALVIPNYELISNQLPKSSKCSIRLWTMHVGHYDAQQVNTQGLLNGERYEALKGIKFGDSMIRNDHELARKTGIIQLARQCDDHFKDWNHILRTYDDPKWARLRSPLNSRIKAGTLYLTTTSPYGRPDCANYHHGLIEHSDSIDTLGRYTDCHLLHGDERVPNPEFKQPDTCATCKYRHQQECMMCGAMPHLPDGYICEWPYRWGQLIEEYANTPKVAKFINPQPNNKGGDRCQHPTGAQAQRSPTMDPALLLKLLSTRPSSSRSTTSSEPTT